MEFQITGTIGDYMLGAKLGEGPLSTVWKAEHRTTGQLVALKQVHLSRLTPKLKKCLECEMTFLSSVNHPNIIRLLHFFKAEGCVFLVLEFCAGGNLASYIKHHGRVQECMARRFMSQLGAGLEVLNSHCIIHRDLKPANILLSSVESEAVLKIADFGLSRSRTSRQDGSAGMVCGSPLYMAPEILQFQQYDEKVDMWSIGTILFELLSGYPPFRGRTNVQLLQNIKSCTCLPFSPYILPALEPDSLDLCLRLLSKDPENHLSFHEFYQHNFLRTGKLWR